MNRTARHAFVEGRVQGVGFRWSTWKEAVEIGVGGWVRNTVDGRVEVWIEGEPEAVRKLESWLSAGPLAARVRSVTVNDAIAQDVSAFSIRPDHP